MMVSRLIGECLENHLSAVGVLGVGRLPLTSAFERLEALLKPKECMPVDEPVIDFTAPGVPVATTGYRATMITASLR